MYEVVRRGAIAHVVIFWPLMQVVVDGWVLPRPRRFLISEYGYIDLYLPTPTRADICSKGREADVRVGDLVRHKLRPELGAGHGVEGFGEHTRATNPWERC